MIDPTDVTTGDELRALMKTPYQNDETPPYVGDLLVGEVEEVLPDDADDEDAEPSVVLYFGGDFETADGYDRRAVFPPDGLPVYERRQGDTWATFSVEGGFRAEFAPDDAETDDADEKAVCGVETDDGTCGRTAGWGRDADSGPCRDHVDEDQEAEVADDLAALAGAAAE
jgi:hypothetical protein